VIIRCASCSKSLHRKRPNPKARCKSCYRTYSADWRKKNRAHVQALHAAWRAQNQERIQGYTAAYMEANGDRVRKRNAACHRRCRRDAKALLNALPCMDCGMRHTWERRARILRRMLPTTAHEIREAWTCVWGDPWVDDAGGRKLYRDLHAIGAVRVGGSWYPQADLRAAGAAA
jgi:hypothetical protein